MSGIEDWDPVPAQNNAAPPVGAPEDHDRSDVNDIAREMMASTRADWEGSATGGGEWRNIIKDETLNFVSGTVIDVVDVDVTAFFPVGRKIKVVNDSADDAYCFVTVSAFPDPNTRITVADFDAAGGSAIDASVSGLEIHNAFGGGFGIRSGAFETAGGALFEIPTVLTAAGINAAIAAAVTNGKIVLLDDDEYVLEAAVVLDSNVEIWGRGMNGSTVLKVAYDGYGITISSKSNIMLRDFTLDGDYSTRAAGGGITKSGTSSEVVIERIKVINAWEHCIHATGSGSTDAKDLAVRNCVFDTFGHNGLFVEDPNGSADRNHYSGLSIIDVGGVGKDSASATGLHVSGAATISDIDVVIDSSAGHAGATGIRLDVVASGGTPEGSNNTTLNGFRINGTLSTQIGLFVGGRRNVISNGYVETTGASARPLIVDGTGGSPDQSLDNHFSGVYFKDGTNCEVSTDALRTEFHGCVFDGQSSVGLTTSGTDTLVKNCTVLGGQPVGIRATGGALDVEISGCTVRDTTGDGIDVQAASERTKLLSNSFDSIGGSDVTDAGTLTVMRGNDPRQVNEERVFIEGVQQDNFGSALIAITGMEGIAFPAGGANGSRRYLVQSAAAIEAGGADTIVFAMRIGSSGDITDGVDNSVTLTPSAAHNMAARLAQKTVTPATSQLVTMSVDSTRADTDIHANASESSDASDQTIEYTYKEYITFLNIEYLDG